jgi:hypothetical protein
MARYEDLIKEVKTLKSQKKLYFYFLFATLILLPLIASAENIDPDNNGSRYAWGENVGWINLKPSQGPGVSVTDTVVTGYAWGENIGWINLHPANHGGVTNDGAGNLLGFAWGENIGWINFAPIGAGVKIDPLTGTFSGKAWGENIGWITFVPNGKPVRTSWKGAVDNCPDDPNKTEPGICGCGVADTDSDGDGTPDCNDPCPNDTNKTEPGRCGCGIADTDTDGDGILDCFENAGPNSGDGNNDGIPDSLQANVVTITSYSGADYFTVVSSDETALTNVQAIDNPSPADAPSNVEFPYGFFGFTLEGVAPGEEVTATLILPPESDINTYWKYGATPDNGTPHWYEFIFDGQTGAEFADNIVILHFIDGLRGDGDITANGSIIDPGGPGFSDDCPNDPNKTNPGSCGCGVAETDTDGDGVADCVDNCPAVQNPDQADSNGNGIGDACDFKQVCSYLGNDPHPFLPDTDVFKFSGTKGETVTIRLEASPPEAGAGKRVTLILTDKIKKTVLVNLDRSELPNEITAKLPATGEYLVTVLQTLLVAKNKRYNGEYCLTLEARPETYQTLASAMWVE